MLVKLDSSLIITLAEIHEEMMNDGGHPYSVLIDTDNEEVVVRQEIGADVILKRFSF